MDEPRDVELTVRLTPEQFQLLRKLAEQRDLPPETMAQLLLASELNREFLRDARLHSLKSEAPLRVPVSLMVAAMKPNVADEFKLKRPMA